MTSLKWAKQVEETHEEMFENTFEELEEKGEVEERDYQVCMNCGYADPNSPPSSCPICGTPNSVFEEVE